MGIPAYTLYPSWPAFTTKTWATQALGVIARRRLECPASRGTTYYFNQSVSGNDTGGGGAGTQASPYLVDTLNSFVTMFTTLVGSGNVAFLMKKDSVLVATNGGGLTINQPNVTLDEWGTGTNSPIATGFVPDDGTGWTLRFGMYYKTFSPTPYWVRTKNAFTALLGGTETVYTRSQGQLVSISTGVNTQTYATGVWSGSAVTSGVRHGLAVGDTVVFDGTNSTPAVNGAFTVASVTDPVTFTVNTSTTVTVAGTAGIAIRRSDNCFGWDSVTNRLYVRVGANLDPASNMIEVCSTNNKGLYVAQKDGCRIQNWTAIGWGMGSFDGGGGPNGASQQYGIHVDVRNTDTCYVNNCKSYYGGHHVLGHLTSGGGAGGGLTLWESCEFGLGRADNTGNGTMFVAYSNDGSHEWILYNSRCRYGILPDTNTTGWSATTVKRGTPFYGHADTTNQTAFALVWNFQTDDHAYGCQQNGNIGNPTTWNTASTNRGVLTNYRAWIIGETFNGGDNTLLAMTHQYVACGWQYLKDRPAAASTADIFLSAGVGTRAIGVFVGVNVERDWSLFTASGANKAWNRNGSVSQYLDFAFCTFRNINCKADFYTYDPNDTGTWGSGLNRVFNSIWSTTSGVALRPNVHMCPNAVPSGSGTGADTAVTGGGRNTAWWRTGKTSGTHTVYGPDNFNGSYIAHDQHPSYKDLTGEQGRLTVPASGDLIYQAANTANMPFTVEWWQDSGNNMWYMPSSPSIGQIQPATSSLFPSEGSIASRYMLLLD